MGSGAWSLPVGGGMTVAIAAGDVVPSEPRDIVVREAGVSDLARVWAIEKASFGDPWGASEFRAVLDSPPTIFLVAADDGRKVVLGYAVALTVLDESEILNIAVDPQFRGRGMGGLLLDAALGAVEARGAVAVFLEVRESNIPAIRLYHSRGFEELSRRKRYYRTPVEDALVLRRAVQ